MDKYSSREAIWTSEGAVMGDHFVEEPLIVGTDERGNPKWAIWTSEGWIDQSKFKDCRTVSTESDGHHNERLRAFLELSGLDAEVQWVVMKDGSLVATQSIDHPLYDGQPGWHEIVLPEDD
tara:strand:+ start:55 stop:417 length:363 start_codon:yes stop_codon:yes gene_type:complete